MSNPDYSMKRFRPMIGKRIRNIKLDADNQRYLLFETDSDHIVFEAVTPDWSESISWFADIIGVEEVLNQSIVSIVDIEMDKRVKFDNRTKEGYTFDDFYGVKIKSNRGICDIIYRNSSYGFYGGDLKVSETIPENVRWQEITTDYPF